MTYYELASYQVPQKTTNKILHMTPQLMNAELFTEDHMNAQQFRFENHSVSSNSNKFKHLPNKTNVFSWFGSTPPKVLNHRG